MIIDCHGHYTTAPKALEDWRNRQIAGIKDPAALGASARRILAWPFERVIVAHNAVIDSGAHAAVERALARYTARA